MRTMGRANRGSVGCWKSVKLDATMGDTVFINGRAAVHAGSAGKSIAFPDVCLCPPTPPAGPIPTPLPNNVQAADLDGGASSVLIEGNPMGKQSSYFKQSTGNVVAQSTGGGVVTAQVQGKAYFQSFAMNVMIEGEPAVRHLDLGHPQPRGPAAAQHAADALAVDDERPGAAAGSAIKDEQKGPDGFRFRSSTKAGNPLAGVSYSVQLSDASTVDGRTPLSGVAKVRGIPKGTYTVTFPEVDSRSISK